MTDQEIAQEIKRIENIGFDSPHEGLRVHHAVRHRDDKYYLYRESASKSILFVGAFNIFEVVVKLYPESGQSKVEVMNRLSSMAFGEIHTFAIFSKEGKKQ